jgi:DNA repair protein RadA/Sms
MAKDKRGTVFVCSSCGAAQPKWAGQCPACQEWNTLAEKVVSQPSKAPRHSGYAGTSTGATTLDRVSTEPLPRQSTGLGEFDRVLGGGLVPGGTVVLGGNPGAGKSTLLLQTGCNVAEGASVLYVSGEESLGQIADRARRLELPTDKMQVACETDVTAIGALIESLKPRLVIVDSIQVVYHPEIDSAPGSVTQVRECAAYLNRLAKCDGIACSLLMIGHINKSESLAGPNTLLHLVDAVFMLSSTDDARYRILRADKNRHGSAAEIGVFAMTGGGLREVRNPSAIFLSKAVDDVPGSLVTPLWEGSRPMLVEIQALADASVLSNPRRVSVGLDGNRVSMLLAVLHRIGGVAVSDMDVYVNVVGGVRVVETSADLAVMLAVAGSLAGRVVGRDAIVFGEVGLSGEVRPCPNGQERMREAAKLGYKKAVVPLANTMKEGVPGLELVPVATLSQAIEWLMSLPEGGK